MNIVTQGNERLTDRGRKLTLLALRLITIVMFFLFGSGLQYTVQRFAPTNQEEFLPALFALICVEAMLTYSRTKALEGREKTVFRISEVITIAVILKIFLLTQNTGLVLSSELASWQNNFFMSFLDGKFITHLIVILGVWVTTNYLMGLFDQLHERELDATWEDIGKLSNSLKNIRSRMIAVMVTMLVFLIILTTMASVEINIPDLLSFTAITYQPVWLVMVFTVLLLTQFSLTQFVLLRSRWEMDRAVMTPAVPRQWLTYGLVFLTITGIVAAFLPTGYSVSFFDLLGGLVFILTQIFSLLFYLLTLPFILLMRLFSGKETPMNAPPPIELPTASSQPNSPGNLPPIFEILRVILFWGAFFSIIGFAFYQIITTNKEVWKSLASLPFFRWFANLFQQLKLFFNMAGKSLQEQMKRLQPSGLPRPSIRFPGFRQPGEPRDPRARIIVLYKSLVEYAGIQGIKREDHQTPYQYEQQLEGNLPEVTGEVEDVTEGFVEARYSVHTLDESTADRLAGEYTRIKKSLDNRTTN
jgi:hypothetical protein